nr:MAG TPA: hypothetical protein [Caudoviricetes sp.]
MTLSTYRKNMIYSLLRSLLWSSRIQKLQCA